MVIVYEDTPAVVLQQVSPYEYICFHKNKKILLYKNCENKFEEVDVNHYNDDNDYTFARTFSYINSMEGYPEYKDHELDVINLITWSVLYRKKYYTYQFLSTKQPRKSYLSLNELVEKHKCPNFLKNTTIYGFNKNLEPFVMATIDPNLKCIKRLK